MRSKTYCEHRVELDSEKVHDNQWVARATIVVVEAETEKRIPIFGRRRATFDSQDLADAYGFELAKIWIDGKLSGANGHGLPE